MSFVWFVQAIIPTAIFFMFWIGALKSAGGNIAGWNLSSITSYYFLLIIAGSLLVSHIEEDVANDDIQQGYMTNYLLKPYSYFTLKFLTEIPWRLLQGSFGLIILVTCVVFFGRFFSFSENPYVIFLSIIIGCIAYVIGFTFKMVVGLSAFWFTDSRGLFQVGDALNFIFGGFVVPITLLPGVVEKLAHFLPFAYITYYPIVAFQGQLNIQELIHIIAIQFLWLGGLVVLYKIMWAQGRKKYTALGQ